MNDWEAKIQELLDGTVDELIVPRDDFLTVRSLLVDKGWLFEVVGEAKHGGVTIYRKNKQSASS
ncbi:MULTISPECIES: hypothetical protein [Exiguobacterium]|uniref:hypothetical protein n=1 Tax=Exiguobacterium TaxID=33986 RepID=UPI001BE8D632|nr:hypothetical protein [Exiguobacterium sp. s146]